MEHETESTRPPEWTVPVLKRTVHMLGLVALLKVPDIVVYVGPKSVFGTDIPSTVLGVTSTVASPIGLGIVTLLCLADVDSRGVFDLRRSPRSDAFDQDDIVFRTPTEEELQYVGYGLMVTVMGLLVTVAPEPLPQTVPLPEVDSSVNPVFLFVSLGIVPIVQETFFRGLVQRYVGAISTSAVGIAVATLCYVLFNSLLALHLAWVGVVMFAAGQVGLTVLLSVVLGVAYDRTENLTVPTVISVTHGIIVTIVVPYLF